MNTSELRGLDAAALQARLDELMEQQFVLRMQIATGQQNNHAALRAARRDVARVKTIMNEKAGADS
jgi:large subunit ribosomal protein L29